MGNTLLKIRKWKVFDNINKIRPYPDSQKINLRDPYFRIVSDKKIKSMKAASLLRPLASKTLPRPLHTSPALAQQAAPVQVKQYLMFHSFAFPNFESFLWPQVYMY